MHTLIHTQYKITRANPAKLRACCTGLKRYQMRCPAKPSQDLFQASDNHAKSQMEVHLREAAGQRPPFPTDEERQGSQCTSPSTTCSLKVTLGGWTSLQLHVHHAIILGSIICDMSGRGRNPYHNVCRTSAPCQRGFCEDHVLDDPSTVVDFENLHLISICLLLVHSFARHGGVPEQGRRDPERRD